jgi:hypothetical protein
VYGKPAAVKIICLVAQEVEKLRIHHGYNEVESVVRVGDNDKEGGFPVPQCVKLQIVRFHKLPQFFYVERG